MQARTPSAAVLQALKLRWQHTTVVTGRTPCWLANRTSLCASKPLQQQLGQRQQGCPCGRPTSVVLQAAAAAAVLQKDPSVSIRAAVPLFDLLASDLNPLGELRRPFAPVTARRPAQ